MKKIIKKVIQVACTATDGGDQPSMLLVVSTTGEDHWLEKRDSKKLWRVPKIGELITIELIDRPKNDWKFIAPSQQ